MQEPTSFNHTQVSLSPTRYPISSYSQRIHASATPSIYDSSGNLGYGVGRLLREAFDRLYQGWHQWWYPAPSKEMLAQRRQAAVYRKRLEAAMWQLDLAVEDIRKNPRAKSSLEHFRRVVKESEAYLSSAPTEKLRRYQKHLLNQLRSKIQTLKAGQLKETLLAYLPLLGSEPLEAERGEVTATSLSSTATEVDLRNQEKRAIEQIMSGFQNPFNVTTLDGTNGFVIDGVNANDYLGVSVSTAGDINGDGKADFVLGAYQASPGGRTSAGTGYVLFGQGSGWSPRLDLTTLNGTNGFAVDGVNAFNELGDSVSTAGDINGDGKADLLLGAPYASPVGRTNAGTAYVVLGQSSGWPSRFDLTTLNGMNGFAVDGVNAGDYLGYSVSTAGDIDGDGKADLVLGAYQASPGGRTRAGTVYVLLGQGSGWSSRFDLTTLNGTNGFAIDGVDANDYLGISVSTAGDINGDGKADLVLGAYQASPGGRTSAGTVYVLLGQGSGWSSRFDLTTLNGTNGFAIDGVDAGDRLGWSVSAAGDTNGDGKADFVLGVPYASPSGRMNAGTVYVLLCQGSSWPSRFDVSTLNGTNGFAVDGVNAGDYLGYSVSTAGDIDGDGKADLILGASGASPGGRNGAGTAYVLLGQGSGWPSRFDLTTLNGTNGFAVGGVNAYDYLGASVNTAGDINGDGKADLVLGAYQASPSGRTHAGTAYVILFNTTAFTLSPNPIPQPVPSLMPLSIPSPMPVPIPTLNLTHCPINQPLNWLYHDMIIANGQSLRLSPMDIATACGNTNQPYDAAYFTVTGIRSAMVQQRNASGHWNIGKLSFFGTDLSSGSVALVHDGSGVAPELNLIATDGQTSLKDQPVQVKFINNSTYSSPTLINFELSMPSNTQIVTVTPEAIQFNVTGKPSNAVFIVQNLQNGYFFANNVSEVAITEFTYYQVQTGQIQIMQTQVGQPVQFDLTLSDGLGSTMPEPKMVAVLGGTVFGGTDDSVGRLGMNVGLGVAGAILVAGGLAAFGLYRYKEAQSKQKLDEMKQVIKLEMGNQSNMERY